MRTFQLLDPLADRVLNEISSAVNGLAEHVVKVTKHLSDHSEQDRSLASSSYWFSITGLAFLTIGFALQIFGAWSQ